MKKLFSVFLTFVILISCAGCNKSGNTSTTADNEAVAPQMSQVKAICELGVMECYYHNVAKFTQEKAESFLWWSKDKHFWIEYSGIVKFGIDMSLLNMKIDGTNITITLPEAKILDCKVDSSSLTRDCFIIDKDSAAITADDEIQAFASAQENLLRTASEDKMLMMKAQERVQLLIQDYINNLGTTLGTRYSVLWIYVDNEGNQIGSSGIINDVNSTTQQ